MVGWKVLFNIYIYFSVLFVLLEYCSVTSQHFWWDTAKFRSLLGTRVWVFLCHTCCCDTLRHPFLPFCSLVGRLTHHKKGKMRIYTYFSMNSIETSSFENIGTCINSSFKGFFSIDCIGPKSNLFPSPLGFLLTDDFESSVKAERTF